jgi:hypothetical protein
MRRRINLFALLVIAAGGAVSARPAPLAATWFNPARQFGSCCEAFDPFGHKIMNCCSATGCAITRNGCFPFQ